jgi:hypothetical protein
MKWASMKLLKQLLKGFLGLTVLVMILFARNARAFPEMIRMGYVNCIACHVSPNGGGILNPYGRESSQAILSTWGSEKEAAPFYGLLPVPSNLDVATYLRGVQTYQNNATAFSGNYYWMQLDAEAALHFGSKDQFTADASIGIDPDVLNATPGFNGSTLLSRHHYLIYRPGGSDDPNSFRVGKFLLDYGVNFSNHTIATRQGIGFNVGNETYNAEYSYQGDTLSGSVTANFGRPDDGTIKQERGSAATVGYALGDHSKVGWSAYYGNYDGDQRELTGPYALLGFTQRFYLLMEAAFQFNHPLGLPSANGLYSYEKLGYEIFKGFHVYGFEQNTVPDFGIALSNQISTGAGLYWYPRPHFSFELEGGNQFNTPAGASTVYGFLVGTVYL